MDGIVAIELAIGLSFMFFVLSVIASGVGEWISRLLTLRAKTLRDGISSLLLGGEGGDLTATLYSNPSIKSLSKANVADVNSDGGIWARGNWKGSWFNPINLLKLTEWPDVIKNKILVRKPGPSAIPARRFSASLIETLLEDNPTVEAEKAFEQIKEKLGISLEPEATAVEDSDKSETGVTPPLAAEPAGPRVGASETPDASESESQAISDELKGQLVSIINSVQREATTGTERYTAFRSNIESWYDESMDRVVGWYKRKLQIVLLVVGLVLAVGLNVNAFTVASELWQDDTQRALIVEQGRTADSGLTEDDADALLKRLQLPIGWTSEESDPRYVSWEEWWFEGDDDADADEADDADERVVWYHIFGWLLTGTAISLGSPFWFDLMNKFVDLRGGGKVSSKEKKKGNGGAGSGTSEP